jgi:HPt (histidine-containing phosphotransfer) domain-containing protein
VPTGTAPVIPAVVAEPAPRSAQPTPRQRIMPVFMDTTVDVVVQIRAAAGARNAVTLARLAHRLKSSSLAVDATELANACRLLELAGIRGDVDAAIEALEPLEREYERTRAAIAEELAGLPG